MRNLKKILALVLALVMSLSLMATASAAETTAAANDYTIASTVLQGLGVVRGDDGGIREADPITRAEVAALAYRIHTADVKDEKANLYYDLKDAAFTDLAPVQAWALGYIGYAHNAQIVKGNGDGTFNPTGNITGYEVLAMTLRAIGYGKNGEFEGAEWQINTAAWARRESLLEGVSPSDQVRLDQPATRGMVFQVLLNAILHNDVQFSYVTPDLYVEADASMAERLKLEVETGVVIANEWAALDADSPLGADKTKVEVSDGTTRTLNDWSVDYQDGLEEIGLSYDLYIYDKTDVLYKADSGLNSIADNEGEGMSVKDAAKKASLSYDDAEYFLNYSDRTRKYSHWLIRYVVDATSTGLSASQLDFLAEKAIPTKGTTANPLEYTRTIQPDDEVTTTDIAIMKNIFYTADRLAVNPDNKVDYWVDGEVYAGTSSLEDLSDKITWNKFYDEYLLDDEKPFSDVENGNWLRVIDNDGDGKAEYVLRVDYVLDTIVETKNDKFYYRALDIEDFTPVEVENYSQAVEDVVLYAKIDGNAYVQKAVSETATFKAVDYKNETATDTNDKVWEQSGIDNETTLPGTLTDVSELTSYTLYLDRFGYVRAYYAKESFALLTELYPTNDWNSAWVVNTELTAEAMLVGDTAVREYKVLNSTYNTSTNPFCVYNSLHEEPHAPWTYPGITDSNWSTIRQGMKNFLQPATHMLGTANEGFVFRYVDNNVDAEHSRNSWTNVARYTQTENGLNLYSAAGTTGNVTTDYIRLQSNVTVDKTNPLFRVEDQYYDEVYTSADRHYVRAVDSTVFFLVTVNSDGTQAIRQFTGYNNVPTLTSANEIRSMYAVAHTNLDNDKNVNQNNYWVADVIVIEMRNWNAYESIALVYSNNSKITSDVKYVQAIDSKLGEITIIPNAYNVWNGQFNGLGFYGLNDIIPVEGKDKTYTATLTPITDDSLGYLNDNNYNDNGIYYGQVRSIWSEDGYSDYVSLDILDQHGLVVGRVNDVRVTLGAWKITADSNGTTNTASTMLLRSPTVNNKVAVGDKVLWVTTSTAGELRTAGFLVDLTNIGSNSKLPAFLSTTNGVPNSIATAQWNGDEFTADYNYEEIIGKRNDQTMGRSAAETESRPQDGFVVDSYTLYVYNPVTGLDEPVKARYSNNNDVDGLWHLHYNIAPNSIVTVKVERNNLMLKDLVLNSKANPVSTTNGVNVWENESWTFVMPAPGTDKVVVGTIFEDTTSPVPQIPANADAYAKVEKVYASSALYIAYRDAAENLTKAAADAKKGLDAVKDAELIAEINAALSEALNKINNAAVYPEFNTAEVENANIAAIEAAKQTGLDKIAELIGGSVEDPAVTNARNEAKAALEKLADELKDGTNDAKIDAALAAAKGNLDRSKTLGAIADAKAAGEAAIRESAESGEENTVTITVNYVFNGDPTDTDTRTVTGTYADGKVSVPVKDVMPWDMPYTVEDKNGTPLVAEGDSFVIDSDGETPIVLKVNVTTVIVDVPQESGRISARTLSGDTLATSTCRILLKDGVRPTEDTELRNAPEGVEIVWSTLAKGEVTGGRAVWSVDVSFTSEALKELEGVKSLVVLLVTGEDAIPVSLTGESVTEGVSWVVDSVENANVAKTNSVIEVTAPENAAVKINGIEGKSYTVKASDTKVEIEVTAGTEEPDEPVDGLLPYRATKDDAGVYNFYGYKDKLTLTEEEAKTALAVELSNNTLKLTANDITFSTSGDIAYYTDNGGKTKTVKINQEVADGEYGAWTQTGELFAIYYKGEVVYYAFNREKGIVLEGLDEGFVVLSTEAAGGSGSSDLAKLKTVDENGECELDKDGSGYEISSDVEYVQAIRFATLASKASKIAYKTDGGWTTPTGDDGWVKVGTPVRVSTPDGLTLVDSAKYQLLLNDSGLEENHVQTAIATVTGKELNAASGVIEIASLTLDKTLNSTAHLTIERVYGVNLDGESIGIHSVGSKIPAADYGLDAGDVMIVKNNEPTIKGYLSGLNMPDTSVVVSAAADSGDIDNFVLVDALVGTPTDGVTIDLFRASKVTWPTNSTGSVVVKCGNEESATISLSGSTASYVRQDAMIELTSSANSAIFKVTRGDSTTAESVGTPVTSEKTVEDILVGSEDMTITETVALTGLRMEVDVSTPIKNTLATKDLRLNAWREGDNTTPIEVSIGDGRVTVDNVTEGVVRPGNMFEEYSDYTIVVTGIAPLANTTFEKLTGRGVEMLGLPNGASLLGASVSYNPANGTVDVTMTIHIEELS